MIQLQPHHLPVLVNPFTVGRQFFPKLQVRNLAEVLEELFNGSKLSNQVGSGFLSDSIYPRYIVNAIAGQSKDLAN